MAGQPAERSGSPFTARFEGLPERHDGSTAFTFELHFSEAPDGLSYRTVQGGLVEAAGADVTHARRLTQGSDIGWEVTAEPNQGGDITISLPARACDAADAVCANGRPLAEAVSATVRATPFTAAFEDAPARHDGNNAFEIRFELSVEPDNLSYVTVRDSLFDVTGGSIANASRLVRNRDRSWKLQVVPSGLGDMTLRLKDTTSCDTLPGVCTPDGRMLDGGLSVTVRGPAEQPGSPFTARFEGLPERHDGSTAFTFELHFSEAPDGLSYRTVQGGLVEAAGADVTHARRLTQGSDIGWEVTAEPNQGGDITISLPARACDAVDAVCANGRPLAEAVSATVRAYTPPPPLTVSWTVPAEHDGRSFEVEIELSEKPTGYSFRTLQDRHLQATGGSVARVWRAHEAATDRNRLWKATVEPDTSTSDVALSYSAPDECGTTHAVCTEDGRKMSNSLSTTVTGPSGISVDDPEADEGDDAEVTFTVTLSKAATRAISVDYATENGTATSGDDYTATNGTLRFAVGDTSKTVDVEVLDDDHDEGSETFKLVLSNPSGAVITDAEGTGTIKNRDPLPRALLARFGRAAAVHVVEQIQQRIEAPRNPATNVRFAGHEVGGLTDAGNAVGLLQSIGSAYGVAGSQTMHGGYGAAVGSPGHQPVGHAGVGHVGMHGGFGPPTTTSPRAPLGGQTMTPAGGGTAGPGMAGSMQPGLARDERLHRPNLLARSEFAVNRATRNGGSIAFWSRTAESTFSGRAGDVAVNGNVRTTMFGADYARDRLILGLSVGRSFGDGAYQRQGAGATDTSVVGFYPWIGYKVNERTTVWGVSGYGRGRLVLSPERGAALTSPMAMRMHAVGVQGQLSGDDAAVGLTLKTDALQAITSIDGIETDAGRLAATRADVSRIRTAIEGSRQWSIGRWMRLRPSIELGVRRDAGDAERGAGVDVATGLLLSEARSGLLVNVRMRRLVMHQADGFEEQGTSISISYNPRPQTPLGWTAEVEPGWGAETDGGAERMWSRETMHGIGASTGTGRRLRGRVGYGGRLGSNWIGAPGMAVTEYGDARRVQFDYQLKPQKSETMDVGLSVIGEHTVNRKLQAASRGVRAEARVSW